MVVLRRGRSLSRQLSCWHRRVGLVGVVGLVFVLLLVSSWWWFGMVAVRRGRGRRGGPSWLRFVVVAVVIVVVRRGRGRRRGGVLSWRRSLWW